MDSFLIGISLLIVAYTQIMGIYEDLCKQSQELVIHKQEKNKSMIPNEKGFYCMPFGHLIFLLTRQE